MSPGCLAFLEDDKTTMRAIVLLVWGLGFRVEGSGVNSHNNPDIIRLYTPIIVPIFTPHLPLSTNSCQGSNKNPKYGPLFESLLCAFKV